MKDYKQLNKCVACDSGALESVVDLGAQPLANNYHSGEGGGTAYPLEMMVCKQCSHCQLSVAVDPEIMFKNYLYVTGTSQTLRDYAEWFAQMVNTEMPTGKMCDIASNDGTQLDAFKDLGWETMGIEPAVNLVKDYKHYVINEFAQNVTEPLQLDVVTAQNVLAHTADPLGILTKIKSWLKPNGRAYIQTSQANMFKRFEFDTIYHEHISFYCASSMTALCRRAGLEIIKVQKTPVHGTSYVFTLQHAECTLPQDHLNADPERYNQATYDLFADNTYKTIMRLQYAVREARQRGMTIVGYGAAAKGMTVLNAASKVQFDFIVDDNPLKQGLFTPGTDLPILSATALDMDEHLFVVPLAWNFYSEIQQRVRKIRGDKPTTYYRYFGSNTVT